ncbi:MAG: hypothetical protein U0M06_07515 [Clostridia bacterium]|nr:hypothetical protein [Clostridia bacterium]
MNNREKLNQMSDDDISYLLCSLVSEVIGNVEEKSEHHYIPEPCEVCPMGNLCDKGKNGFTVWLNQEAKEDA